MPYDNPQASVIVSNSVATEVGSNSLIILGTFDGLQSAAFPTRSSFCVVAKVWGVDGEQTCELKMVDAETNQVVAEAGEHKFASRGKKQVHTAISLFQAITIPKSGVYEARAIIGGKVIGFHPIVVSSGKGE